MTNKKNKFLTFCFSIIPGAGEMYLGFYKMGISLMTVFWLTIMVTAVINIPVFLFLLPIIWFYSFFHVHNLNSMPEEEFYALEDDWLLHFNTRDMAVDAWLLKHKKAVAVVMIFFGVSLIWNLLNGFMHHVLRLFHLSEEWYNFIRTITHSIPQTIIGIFIIYVGILLIRGKKEDLDQNQE